jgi:hypothetical protein
MSTSVSGLWSSIFLPQLLDQNGAVAPKEGRGWDVPGQMGGKYGSRLHLGNSGPDSAGVAGQVEVGTFGVAAWLRFGAGEFPTTKRLASLGCGLRSVNNTSAFATTPPDRAEATCALSLSGFSPPPTHSFFCVSFFVFAFRLGLKKVAALLRMWGQRR